MILLFNHLPVSESVKIAKFVELVQESYGSDFYSLQGEYWNGDNLTVESLFPSWIIKKYEESPNTVTIIPIIKNYLRWLFSLKYGYGASLDWENIRCAITVNEKLLQGFAESYFPGADFSDSSISDLLPNIRKFSIQIQTLFFDIKGTPKAIKHALVSLMGYSYFTTQVYANGAGLLTIKANILEKHKPFIENYLVPAGVIVNYESV
jgi:hypothetical protein